MRPGTLCFLKSGKAIGAQSGFAATWNWMVNFINNLSGEGDIEVDTSDSDHPLIKYNGSSGGDEGDGGSSGGESGGEGEPPTYDGDVTITGTDGVEVTGKSNITIESDENSNVEVKASQIGDNIKLVVGVFYI